MIYVEAYPAENNFDCQAPAAVRVAISSFTNQLPISAQKIIIQVWSGLELASSPVQSFLAPQLSTETYWDFKV